MVCWPGHRAKIRKFQPPSAPHDPVFHSVIISVICKNRALVPVREWLTKKKKNTYARFWVTVTHVRWTGAIPAWWGGYFQHRLQQEIQPHPHSHPTPTHQGIARKQVFTYGVCLRFHCSFTPYVTHVILSFQGSTKRTATGFFRHVDDLVGRVLNSPNLYRSQTFECGSRPKVCLLSFLFKFISSCLEYSVRVCPKHTPPKKLVEAPSWNFSFCYLSVKGSMVHCK